MIVTDENVFEHRDISDHEYGSNEREEEIIGRENEV